ncbi:PAS domain S-box protein [Sinorhizobium medicae]|uniref:PAS domain S-box protein n=1 Tax=Sinorhizobium medicae TaxID=110321 RepID=UPI000420C649|nr:PAS domain S-box protein [Sinorhizobium medicae]
MHGAEILPKGVFDDETSLHEPDFRAVLDALTVAVYATDAEGVVTYYNAAAAAIAGRDPELGKDRWCVSWQLRRPDGSPLPHEQCPMARALKERRPIRGEELIAVRPNGASVPLLPHPTPMFDAAGALTGAVNVLIDLSNTKDMERSSRYLAAIVESSDDAIVAKDLNGIITSWNRGAERLFGYTAEDVIGKSITILIPQDRLSEEPGILERIRRGDKVDHFETKRRRKDGSLIDVSLTVSPVKDATGRIVGASKIARDITETKRAAEALSARFREQAALYRFTERVQRTKRIEDVFEASLDAIQGALSCDRASILLFDPSGTIRFVASRGLSEAYQSAVDGHSPWASGANEPEPIFVENVDSADMSRALKEAIAQEGIGALGFVPLVLDGKLIGKFMTYYDEPHRFAESEIGVAVTIARQLGFSLQRMETENARRQAEERLRRNEANERARAAELAAIMEAVPALIWIARTPDCHVISGNKSSYEMLRLPHDSNLSLSAPPGERPTNFRVFSGGRALSPDELPVQRAARGEEVRNFEEEVRFEDGSSRYIFGNATPLRDAAGEVIGAVAASVDITERRQAEEALQESERRLQLALDAGHMGAWEWNLGTDEVIWSPGLEALHRLERGSFGRTLADFKRNVHPDDLPLIDSEIAKAVETKGDYHVVYRARLLDGTVRWMEAFAQFSPSNGPSRRLIGVCMDITERREAEAQRNLLVAELSHRVKNTLAIVGSIARQTFSTSPDARTAHRSFDARIRALAQTHTRLAEASWSGVSLQTVLYDELAPYQDDGRTNVKLQGPTAMLPPKHALTLGMAAHELATNAAKHGALSVKSGKVDIEWVVDVDTDRLRICWRESGGPPVVTPAHNGFGRLLLERVLASDLGGEVHLEFKPQGLVCTIDVPYPRGAPG